MSEERLDLSRSDAQSPRDLTNVEMFAEMYPAVPRPSLLRCMFEAEVEADFADAPGDRAHEVARLSIMRLDELSRHYRDYEIS